LLNWVIPIMSTWATVGITSEGDQDVFGPGLLGCGARRRREELLPGHGEAHAEHCQIGCVVDTVFQLVPIDPVDLYASYPAYTAVPIMMAQPT
jgi:hypothetical protein